MAAAVSAATVLVRLVFPLLSGQIGQSHLWQWPQFVAMFGLGIVAAQRGWLAPVPDRIRRGCGYAALFGVLAFPTLAGTMVLIDVDPEVWFEERLHWAPMILAAIEGPLVIGFGIWMLGVAQHRLDRRPGPFGRAMTRSAYAAFILQGVVLIGLMIALRSVDLPAELKALGVAALGVALSSASPGCSSAAPASAASSESGRLHLSPGMSLAPLTAPRAKRAALATQAS